MKVAGIGLTARATRKSLECLLTELLDADYVAILSAKKDHFQQLVDHQLEAQITLKMLSETDISGVATPTFSARIQERFQTGSVCEALALVACGPNAVLKAPRRVSDDGMVTIAIAEQTPQLAG